MNVTLYTRDNDVYAVVAGIAQERHTITVRQAGDHPGAADLIIIDAALPGLDAALRDLARQGAHPRPLIVLLSANPYIGTVVRRHHIDAIVAKPLATEQIQAMLAGAVARQHN